MKEQIDTIPVNDAFDATDECPFCWLERKAEQSTLRYVAGPGASYMEPDVRAATDDKGFCRVHMKKLYDYGNTLGAALMLQTHFAGLLEEFQEEKDNFKAPEKKGLFSKKKQTDEQTYWQRLEARRDSCFVCDRIDYHMQRYIHTFFVMLKDPQFRHKVESGKGFCLGHFAQLMSAADSQLPANQQEWFYRTMLQKMEENLIRVKEDLDWLIAKYDYRNAGAPWGNSKDALQRTMQKLAGIYPADAPYKNE